MQSINKISLNKVNLAEINNKPFKMNFDPVLETNIKIKKKPQALTNKEIKSQRKKKLLTHGIGAISCLCIASYYLFFQQSSEDIYLPDTLKVNHVVNIGLENKVNTNIILKESNIPEILNIQHKSIVSSVIVPYKLPENLNVVLDNQDKNNSKKTSKQNKIALLTDYIVNGYQVSESKAHKIVYEAFHISEQKGIDPLLLLAITAVESSFNDKAKNSSGAVGLVQALPRAHPEKIREIKLNGGSVYGIRNNLSLGAQIYKEYLDSSKGNQTIALQRYNGSLNDGNRTYSKKVMAALKPMKKVIGKHR